MAHQKMFPAEAEVEARNCERRNSDIAFQDINQEFEPQRFSATSSKSMGRSGAERQNQLIWRIGVEK